MTVTFMDELNVADLALLVSVPSSEEEEEEVLAFVAWTGTLLGPGLNGFSKLTYPEFLTMAEFFELSE